MEKEIEKGKKEVNWYIKLCWNVGDKFVALKVIKKKFVALNFLNFKLCYFTILGLFFYYSVSFFS